jgi:uncharacterized protein YggT (Ycf19 family)
MAVHETSVRSVDADGTSRVERTVTPSPLGVIRNVIYVIFYALEALLFIRFLLSLFGANRLNGFANFVYNVTAPFVAPFRGLFGVNGVIGNGLGRFEYETIIAMLVYGILATIILMLLRTPEKEEV